MGGRETTNQLNGKRIDSAILPGAKDKDNREDWKTSCSYAAHGAMDGTSREGQRD